MSQVPLAPPPQTGQPIDSWLYLLWRRLTQAGQILWDTVDTSGSNLTDIETRNHADLQNHNTADYYHLTQTHHTDLTDGGTTSLHRHTNVTVADAAGDTTTFVLLVGGATGDQPILSDAGLSYNADTNLLTVSGALNTGDLTASGNTTLGDGTADTTKVSGQLVLPKTSNYGIKVDTATPDFGWRDILGPIGVKTAGATDPIWTVYRGSIYAYTFDTATAEAFFTFHIPHDWVPGVIGEGRTAYIHMHWSQNVVDTGGAAGVPGVAEWNFDISYADGHGTAGGAADPFVAPITVTVTQQASTTQYGHMIAEVAFANDGGTGGLLDYNAIQVDGLILVRAYRVKGNPADTLNQAPFGHTCDIHYQSTNIATKNKAPNFYT